MFHTVTCPYLPTYTSPPFPNSSELPGDLGLLLFCLYFFEQYLSELMGTVAESERGKFLRNVRGTVPWIISQQLCAMSSCAW